VDPFAFIWSNLTGPNSQLGSVAKRKLKKHKVTSPFRSFLSSTYFPPLVCQRSLVLYAATICTKLSGLHYDARGYLALRNIQTLKTCNYFVSAIVYYVNIVVISMLSTNMKCAIIIILTDMSTLFNEFFYQSKINFILKIFQSCNL